MKVPALTTDVCRDWHGGARSHPFAPVGPLLSFLLLTVLATSAHSESSSSDFGSGAAAGTASFASHPEVQAYLRYFQGRGRPSMERWLERGERYVPMIRQRLNDAMLPEELCWLPLIESGFSNGAVSSAGAAGMWQFMPSTARMYGLRVDQYVDERCDPVKATSAAVRHLSDLLERFDSPYLAAAAYNAGTDRVLRGLDRLEGGAKGETGKSQKASKPGPAEDGSMPDSRRVDAAEGGVRFDDADFFRLSDASLLARETRNYVPQFIAASMIAANPEEYGFSAGRAHPLSYDSLVVTRPVRLDEIARLARIPSQTIRELNPQYLHGVTPPGSRSIVRVPKRMPRDLETQISLLPTAVPGVMGRERGASAAASRGRILAVLTGRPQPRHVRVLRGETLQDLAARCGVSGDRIARINLIPKGYRLRWGQLLRLP